MHGILPLHKPRGMTSFDCVGKLRRLTQIKKIGHTGTLDPNVTGVLPICFGEATKAIPFLEEQAKTYVAEVCLGQSTNTEDKDGYIVEEAEVIYPTSAEIDAVLNDFTGKITQLTPLYSAVKVKGKKLYEYAREGIPVERPMRHITIFRIDKLAESPNEHSFTIEVTCSKGTYIRTLCVDIGKRLGFPAHMGKLVRTATDGVPLSETVTFDLVEEAIETGTLDDYLLPIESVLTHLPVWQVDETMKVRVQQGQKLSLPPAVKMDEPFQIMYQDQLLAIYRRHPQYPNIMKPIRVFNMHKV